MIYQISRWVEVELVGHHHKFSRPSATVQLSWTDRAVSIQRELNAAKDGGMPNYTPDDMAKCLEDIATYLVEVDGKEVKATTKGLDEGLPPDLICMLWLEFYAGSRITPEMRGKSDEQSPLDPPSIATVSPSTIAASA